MAGVLSPMANGKATGNYEIFADGFRPDVPVAGRGLHRPTGLAVGRDGSLYVADDAGERIWRIMYTGAK